ncbi:hypothetical protein [Sphingomonas hankookensis]|uniref:hypothetical protein n=1 Tax=Sphingomonas hankookensis TaxID=563996 RepID=UPI003D302D4D
MIRALSIVMPLALLGACNQQGTPPANNLDTLDAELLRGNAGDPAVTAALQDQIMVDPGLTGQSGNGAVRPPDRPYSAAAPAANVASGGAARGNRCNRHPGPGRARRARAGARR